jgi:hypothetical protein
MVQLDLFKIYKPTVEQVLDLLYTDTRGVAIIHSVDNWKDTDIAQSMIVDYHLDCACHDALDEITDFWTWLDREIEFNEFIYLESPTDFLNRTISEFRAVQSNTLYRVLQDNEYWKISRK